MPAGMPEAFLGTSAATAVHTSRLPVPDRCRDLPFPVAVSHCQFLYATILPFSDCMASVTSRSLGSVLEELTLSPENCYSRSTKRGF